MKCWVWVLIAVIVLCLCNTTVIVASNYRMLSTDQGDASPNMFENHGETKCIPGPSKDAAYYSDTYGGICDDQEYVHKLGHEYAVTDGIGGSLLSQ
jgi:hypothetical protein